MRCPDLASYIPLSLAMISSFIVRILSMSTFLPPLAACVVPSYACVSRLFHVRVSPVQKNHVNLIAHTKIIKMPIRR